MSDPTAAAVGCLRGFARRALGARDRSPAVEEAARALPRLLRRVPLSLEGLTLDLPRAAPGSPLYAAAAAELTNGETWLFRDRALFSALERELAGRRPAPAQLRVWSAGCSTGEEAHSLAFTARRALARGPVSVLGTDVDGERLELARAGRWAARAARGQPLPAGFALEGPDGLEARPLEEVQLSFAHHNLASDPPPGLFDLILCRNVLLYLSDDAARTALATLRAALRGDGLLVLGASDVIDRPAVVPVDLVADPGGSSWYRARKARATPAPERLEPAPAPVLPAPAPGADEPGAAARRLVVAARTRLAAGDAEAAEIACVAALDQAPDLREARALLGELARRRGDADLARLILGEDQGEEVGP